MGTQETYLSLDAARDNFLAEPVDAVTETPDYLDIAVTPPGEYLSQRRRVTKVTKKPDNSVTFELTLEGGIRTLDTGLVFGNGKYPFRTWVSTKLFTQQGKPGQTSGVAQYLKEAGYDPKTLRTQADILDAMEQSQEVPLKVYVGWTDRGEKQPDSTYTNLNLKTKDFINGQAEDGKPTYTPQVERNGKKVTATEKIGGFRSYGGF